MNYDIIKNSKILIVEDQPMNLKVFVSYLSKYTDKLLMAKNGNTGIELAEKEKPDIILLDIMMPDINGYEVCKILKEKETTKDIPVIFLSVLSKTQDVVKGFEVGAVDYIIKPIKYHEVLARLLVHLKINT